MTTSRQQGQRKPRRRNDELLKGVFEENFPDFLQFMYPNSADLFDLSRGFTFMDKELLEVIPQREQKKGKRIADLLVKVYLKDGTEKWILVNIEIEGGSSKEFPFRFFQYHYRILDRYEVPVESIAVFTGDHRQHRPSLYRHDGIRTSIEFRYLSYHIFDNSEEELLKTDNIFGYIVLACQKALLEGRVAEEELAEHRSTIARALIGSKKYDKDRIISFLGFLKNFLFIEDKQINRIFDSYIYQVTGGTIDMGVIEILKKQERQAGIKQGIEKERARAEAEKLAEKLDSALEFKKMGVAIADIAKALGLTVEQVNAL
ncbi:hypothetical protein FAZ19_09630 [Sphingobacterium alkalisoli]|uniref:Rpn family recombination-promoting nuclease/putative transposase n=1 Tax=Sphingobacterium alkalisoli TaxID=1874115 RepID=A0A4U0H1E4_9SPHI|nr:hypothetical protein [Sphingobacterium alkalisoli]TJY65401.1 hypothetical protein FAZ19_09630 [Sphingobacterium alkalisoli]GGH20676.1 hypothetical protein GCM10011418_26080 [Sphingobacterium alkalisoli]